MGYLVRARGPQVALVSFNGMDVTVNYCWSQVVSSETLATDGFLTYSNFEMSLR
jgi:hypothetical protein